MKTRLLSMFAAIFFLFLFHSFSNTIYALSPGPQVHECGANMMSHGNCEQIMCEWSNISKNWPEKTGYHEDCSKTSYSIFNYDVFLVIGIIGLAILITVFLIRKDIKEKEPIFINICNIFRGVYIP